MQIQQSSIRPFAARSPRLLAAGLLVCCVCISQLGCGGRDEAEGMLSDLFVQVDSLRRLSAYSEALQHVEAGIDDRIDLDGLKPHQRIDIEVELETLATIASLPADARGQLALADRMTLEVDRLYADWEYAKGLGVAADQLDIRRIHLGARHPEVAKTLVRIGDLLHEQGDYGEACVTLREALDLCRTSFGEQHPLTARCLYHLGMAVKNSRGRQEALPLYEQSLAIFRQTDGEQSPAAAYVIKEIGNLYRGALAYEPAKAEEHYRRALAILKRWYGPDDLALVEATNELATFLQHALGRFEETETHFRHSFEILSSNVRKDHPAFGWPSNGLSSMAYLAGDRTTSLSLRDRAASATVVQRRRTQPGFNRMRFAASGRALGALIRLSQGDWTEAWQMLDEHVAQVEQDFALMADPERLTPEELSQVDSLRKMIAGGTRELRQLRNPSLGDATSNLLGRIEEVTSEVLRAKSAWTAMEHEINSRNGEIDGRMIPLERVQAALDDRTAILGWLSSGFRRDRASSVFRWEIWAYLIRRTGSVQWVPIHRDSGEFEPCPVLERMARLEQMILRAGAWPQHLNQDLELARLTREVWKDRVEPVMPMLEGVERLIVPGGGRIPLEILVDSDGRFLSDRFSVTYVPSASVFVQLHERGALRASPAAPVRALLVGDPPFNEDQRTQMENESAGRPFAENLEASRPSKDGNPNVRRGSLEGDPGALEQLPRLSYSREEVRRAARFMPEPTLLLGADASEERIEELNLSGELREFDIIHIATHAIVTAGSPERSSLILSQVRPSGVRPDTLGGYRFDSLITAEEILWGWDLDADLVTLSGCATASGRAYLPATGMKLGMTQALFAAGARSLLVTLWKVEDRATALLMERFYENLTGSYRDDRLRRWGARMSKADALREAKSWLRDLTEEDGSTPYRHPAYWSAFILIGDPD